MSKNTKNLFNNAAKNTADFFVLNTADDSGMSDGDDVIIANPSEGGIYDAVKKTAKKFANYGNRMEKYNAYLNTLKRLDVGLQKMSGKVATGVKAPSGPGRATGIKSTLFSDKVDEWNSRMRKFAVARYYAQLGKK